jgi:hypothetical protein
VNLPELQALVDRILRLLGRERVTGGQLVVHFDRGGHVQGADVMQTYRPPPPPTRHAKGRHLDKPLT